jgi:hypothetical protein
MRFTFVRWCGCWAIHHTRADKRGRSVSALAFGQAGGLLALSIALQLSVSKIMVR